MDSNYYYCKCSICFENDSEMEFINCGDQYCFTCLERYVEYWIREGSWGLLPAELTCPVCGVEMLEDDWMPYISARSMDLWHKFQVKRRETLKKLSIQRNCPICNHSQLIMSSTPGNLDDFIIIGSQLSSYLDAVSFSNTELFDFDVEGIFDLIKERNSMELIDFTDSCQDFFDDFLNLIEKIKSLGLLKVENKDLIRLVMEFGRMFLRFINEAVGEDEEEGKFILINMELNFQMTFPFSVCDVCGLEFCLPCQAASWFHSTVHGKTDSGSKQCPRCFVAIEKEPEGCNEMRCNYCGLKFCWECGRKWSRDCGIYKCKITTEKEEDDDEDENVPRSEMKNKIFNLRDPEIGVPNVQAIHNLQREI